MMSDCGPPIREDDVRIGQDKTLQSTIRSPQFFRGGFAFRNFVYNWSGTIWDRVVG